MEQNTGIKWILVWTFNYNIQEKAVPVAVLHANVIWSVTKIPTHQLVAEQSINSRVQLLILRAFAVQGKNKCAVLMGL
jgi:hypothetical protein